MNALLITRWLTGLRRRGLRQWSWVGLAVVSAIASLLLSFPPSPATTVANNASNYELARQAAFNQVETYPLQSLPSSPNYRPNGEWLGRLILPTPEDYVAMPGDWAWLEVWHSPVANPNLIGQKVRLTWEPSDQSAAYIKLVTTDIRFSDQAERFLENGNIVPTRLNGRNQVGPMQSLAGARPQDDMTVRLVSARLIDEGGSPVLQTAFEPIQITGREYALVKILEPDTTVDQPLPSACPGEPPCPTEYFKVQHYRATSGAFDGDIETVRIPQQPKLNGDRYFSTIRDLETSPAGEAGWYIYGARDANNLFTVQAVKPRSLFQLTPDEVILGERSGLNYIDRLNWAHTPAHKGTLQRVLVSPTAPDQTAALEHWQIGDYALVIHLFGGIGGENREFTPLGTVTGHFAYGLAQVVQEPLAQELQFDIKYQQIYAHNSSGIVSGTHDWSAYAGDMQRGWIGQRPFSDVIVKQDAFITQHDLGDISPSLFRELLIQAQILTARYRTGDGTGVAAVTPATSCVQDSSQALFIATQQVRRQIEERPEIAAFVRANPNHPGVQKFNQFVSMGTALEASLVPYGVIRRDWQNNVETLAGVESGNFISDSSLVRGILSWRNMMPRWAHDDVSQLFLTEGADLWFLRTNQLGGYDPTIEPIPATLAMGSIPGVGRALKRFTDAFAVPMSPRVWGTLLGGLLIYGLAALPYGLKSGFLRPQWAHESPLLWVLNLAKLFILPALLEEVGFRVLLLPHPIEGVPGGRWLLWALLSFGLFVLYHWVIAKTVYQQAQANLTDRRFILLMGWLALVLISVYWITGSLWAVVLLHWGVVVVWIYGFGGKARLLTRESRSNRPKRPLRALCYLFRGA